MRSGISHLTIVDSDSVCITNVNRQLQDATKTVDTLSERGRTSHTHFFVPIIRTMLSHQRVGSSQWKNTIVEERRPMR